jgi:hypothetical protein
MATHTTAADGNGRHRRYTQKFGRYIMSKLIKYPATGLLILTILMLPLGSAALAQEYIESEDASGGAMIYDTVIVRPISALATLASTAVYVLGLPFSALGGNTDEASEKLVKEPFEYTFQRPLGEF